MAMTKYIYALMTDRRHGLWDRLVKIDLLVLSFIYGLIVRVTRGLYRSGVLPSYRPAKPVISIGNITIGGVGKTPLVIAVVKFLQSRGLRVAILTRGYMPRSTKTFSDEARMLEEHLPMVPVCAGRDRRASIKECLKHHAVDVFVCDDAFQHWPLQRDLDIVAVDAVNPFGNGHMLPRGILREPLNALLRAGIIVLTKTDQPRADTAALHQRLEKLAPKALVVESRHTAAACVEVYTRSGQDVSHLKGVRVVGFCGIADPASFRHSLHEAGFDVANVFVFMDHHVYTEEDMAMVRRYALDHDIQMIVTTHKDAVKIGKFQGFWEGFKVHYLQLELEIVQGKNAFIEGILSVVHC